jgi:hypothetical protein
MKKVFVLALVLIVSLCSITITTASIGTINIRRLDDSLNVDRTILYGDPIGGGGPPGAPPIEGNGTGN